MLSGPLLGPAQLQAAGGGGSLRGVWSSAGIGACWAWHLRWRRRSPSRAGDPRDRALARFPARPRRGPRVLRRPRALGPDGDGLRLGAACRIWHRRLPTGLQNRRRPRALAFSRSSGGAGRRWRSAGSALVLSIPLTTPYAYYDYDLVMLLLPLAWLLRRARATGSAAASAAPRGGLGRAGRGKFIAGARSSRLARPGCATGARMRALQRDLRRCVARGAVARPS